MVYEKNRLNEAGVWFIVLASTIVGPFLFINEPGNYGKFVGVFLTAGGVILIFYMLFYSVQKITTHHDTLELQYYLRKKSIPYSSIKDVRLAKQDHSSGGITRIIDIIEIYLYPDQKILLGGNFGGFFKHTTRKLYQELRKHVDQSVE